MIISCLNKLQLPVLSTGFRLRRARFTAALMAAVLVTAGCSGTEEEFDLNQNIQDAYIDAQAAVNNGNYRKAISIFEALQARFPFSDFSTQIQLELAYSYYKDGKSEQAIEASETFLRENAGWPPAFEHAADSPENPHKESRFPCA